MTWITGPDSRLYSSGPAVRIQPVAYGYRVERYLPAPDGGRWVFVSEAASITDAKHIALGEHRG